MSACDFATFEAWHLKAEEDFHAASILTDHHGPAATICFLCQQTAEKYLKGYILLNRRTPKRIHHLDVLLEGCIASDSSFQELVEDAVVLKRYYIESRYPDDLPELIQPEEAAQALAAASHLREFVLSRVKQLGNTRSK